MTEQQPHGRSALISSASRQKACSSCIKAKRRCDLRHPACRRCAGKGIHCHYPSTRLHTAVQRTAAALAATVASGHSHRNAREEGVGLNNAEDGLFQLPSALFSSPGSRHRQDFCHFFLSPSSWSISQPSPRPRPVDMFHMNTLMSTVQQVQRWLKQWVDEGFTMFIHRRLYHERLPKCIQDAYTACATYLSRTEANKQMILGIIEERTSLLLQEQDQDQDQDQEQLDSISPKKSGVFEHLARVQALLVYQIIRLYDGDIRQRSMAEQLIPTLSRWNNQMLECACLSSEYVRSISAGAGAGAGADSPQDQRDSTSAWKAWILAESVRRTWLVAGHIQCIYLVLSQGLSACPGGLMFTARAGLWDAPSAYTWRRTCQEQDVLFLRSREAGDQLFSHNRPEEIDDFGRFVLGITAGQEKVGNWVERSVNGGFVAA